MSAKQLHEPAPKPSNITLPIEGMTCASCVSRVERALKKIPNVIEANVNLATESAVVHMTAPNQAALIAAIEDAGYAVPMPSVPEMQEVWAPANSALQLGVTGKQDVKAALETAVKNINMQIETNHAANE